MIYKGEINMEKTTLNPFENAKRTAKGSGGGSVTPEQIEQLQSEIDVLGSENRTQTQDITDIKAQLTELASAYSTTEHKTGRKWIDGKDIYEKVIALESAINVTTNWTDLDISNADYDVMIHANGLHADGSFYPLILDLHNSEQATTVYAKASASIDVKTLVFEYTKPTL